MIKSLDIIKGAVAKKDLMPVLKHIRIANGWVTSTNGRMTISTPIPNCEGLDVIVPADKFRTAIKACKEPKFKITPGGKLSITGKKFRALIPLLEGIPFPTPSTNGVDVLSSNLLDILKRLSPFIGDDASRPWSGGILLYNSMAYATNNTIIGRIAVSWEGPAVNLPAFLVDELLRLKRSILSIQTSGRNITFQLEDNIWLNSNLLSVNWPNVLDLFNRIDFSNISPISEYLLESIGDIIPFCPDSKFPRIRFTEEGVTTDDGNHSASVDIKGLYPSIWRAEPLINLLDNSKGEAIGIDFSKWPSPCPWEREDGMSGLIIGLKQ